MNRRKFLAAAVALATPTIRAFNQSPNIVLINADDLGYGDVGCYGSRIRTPNIDRLASEGMRFTDFYATSSVCSPSRAALMTGRYPVRTGVAGVLQPFDTNGLPASETTVAQMLKTAGYRTMCVGKWHLGSRREFMPTNRGFDEYFGIPYSNDMWPLPLMRGTDVVEETANLESITVRYTEQAVSFIQRSKESPFFLYFAHTSPHIPLLASVKFRGGSELGAYGDVVEEMDWSVGEVLRALDENGLAENTLVLFTSDNGPWYQGSRGRFRGRKGETFEGGMRVPFLARLPGKIEPGSVCRAMATNMDFLPTLARASNAALPAQPLDGMDIWPLLSGEKTELERQAFLYFTLWHLQCARVGPWKLHLSRFNKNAWGPDPAGGSANLPLAKPELYNLENDPEETYDCSQRYPKVVADIRAMVEYMLPTLPEQVQSAWSDTMRRRVTFTPAGALPVEEKP